ncbi:hypothetical protein CMEL01_15985 [Colletotrichum melonis]|uniref:Uncharacterized protein n=1 Tax=Colletotrichum melonis TaxID=1209925 RepID=A0AAI9UI85_9PEZI|nr:hypothetical protein CMEL01_15985 [Colletotrichum melonis]
MDQVEHLKAEKICAIREEPPEMEWLDKYQKQRLQRRSGETNEAEKWREMYSVLFPGAREIPSPYQEESENYEEWKDPAVERSAEYLDRELPRSLRLELDQKANPGFERLSEKTTSQLVDIVRETQLSLFCQYTSSVLCKSNEESAKTKSTADTSGERCNFPRLTLDDQMELGKQDPSSARANEFLNSSVGTPTTYPFEEHWGSTIPSASGFDGEHDWSLDWGEVLPSFLTADNVPSSELPTYIAYSRPLPPDLSTSIDTFEGSEFHWVSFTRLDKRDQLNQLNEVGNTAVGLASYTGGTNSSAEPQKPRVVGDWVSLIEQQDSS